MLFRFCLYGFLKNQRYFEPFLVLIFLERGLSFFLIGLLIACRDLTVNLLEIPSGAIADAAGRRGSMMLSFVAYLISFAILASVANVSLLMLGMFAYGVGDTFRTGTHKAMIFEWLRLQGRSDEKTRVYGLTRSWSQIGSALSGLIAAAFVLVSGNYQYVFWAAMIPYVLNLINFAGYPSTLDGDHEKSTSPKTIALRMWASLKKTASGPRLRSLIVEAVSWEGYLAAVKDYLQPVLQGLAISAFIHWSASWGVGQLELNEAQQTAVLIGPVYLLLFLGSAYASRRAHEVEQHFGGLEPASRWLWWINGGIYLLLAGCAFLGLMWLTAISFASLVILKNVWRPILISRFDQLTDPDEGATVLSIESQARHGATMVFAPLTGLLIDLSNQQFWIIGLMGAGLAVVALSHLRLVSDNGR